MLSDILPGVKGFILLWRKKDNGLEGFSYRLFVTYFQKGNNSAPGRVAAKVSILQSRIKYAMMTNNGWKPLKNKNSRLPAAVLLLGPTSSMK